jgi:hypothetical protein
VDGAGSNAFHQEGRATTSLIILIKNFSFSTFFVEERNKFYINFLINKKEGKSLLLCFLI